MPYAKGKRKGTKSGGMKKKGCKRSCGCKKCKK